MSLKTKIYDIQLTNCLYNASGVYCREKEELDKLLNSKSGALITKSCTLNSRKGNPEPRYYCDNFGTINSMGLPNNSVKFYTDWIKENMLKPTFLSITELNFENFCKITQYISDMEHIKLPEFNLSCPNIIGKPQIGYDFEKMEEYLRKITEIYNKPFGVKLPPYFDPVHFQQVSDILNNYNKLKYITAINSIGNGLIIDIEKETTCIHPKNGMGGIGGKYILPTALSNVNNFYRLLPNKDIIGCGGIYTGGDIFAHILAGASAVQIGSCLYEEGIDCFNRLSNELLELMKNKGYNNISEFKGQLKTSSPTINR